MCDDDVASPDHYAQLALLTMQVRSELDRPDECPAAVEAKMAGQSEEHRAMLTDVRRAVGELQGEYGARWLLERLETRGLPRA